MPRRNGGGGGLFDVSSSPKSEQSSEDLEFKHKKVETTFDK